MNMFKELLSQRIPAGKAWKVRLGKQEQMCAGRRLSGRMSTRQDQHFRKPNQTMGGGWKREWECALQLEGH